MRGLQSRLRRFDSGRRLWLWQADPASIKVTFDLYGHLMPGSEREAAGLLDASSSARAPWHVLLR